MTNEEKSRQPSQNRRQHTKSRGRFFSKHRPERPDCYSKSRPLAREPLKPTSPTTTPSYQDKILGNANLTPSTDLKKISSQLPTSAKHLGARKGEDVLKIIPIGGWDEGGRNMTNFY